MNPATFRRHAGPGGRVRSVPRAAGAVLLVVALTGCASNRARTDRSGPPFDVGVRYALGSPVDAPAPAVAPGAGPLLRLTLLGLSLPDAPAVESEPVASLSRLILDAAGEPLPTAPLAAESVRLFRDVSAVAWPSPDDGDGSGRAGTSAVRAASASAILPPGATVFVRLTPAAIGPARSSSTAPPADPLELGIVSPSAAGGDRPRLILTAAGRDPVAASGGATTGPAQPTGPQSVVIDWPLDGPTGAFGLVVPAPPSAAGAKGRRPRGDARVTVWRVTLSALPDDDPDGVAAVKRILDDLTGAAAAATPSTRGAALAGALSVAAAAGSADALRGSLLAACADVGAELCAEAALLVDEAGVAPAAAAVSSALTAAPAGASGEALGWLCDRAALAELARMQANGTLPDAFTAMLAARFGEAGRDATAVADLAAASPDRADFGTRVRAENLILLEDASPSARVRAFDWMELNGVTVAGYDPLSPPARRRAAIEAYLQSLSPAAPAPAAAPVPDAPASPGTARQP